MLPMRCFPIVVLLALASAGCSKTEPAPASERPAAPTPPASPATAVSEATETFALETNEHRLRLLATDAGTRYTVEALDGRVLAQAIDEAALARDYPHLSELAQSGVDGVHLGIGYD